MKTKNKNKHRISKNLLRKLDKGMVLSIDDYMKAIHIADRELNLENGFKAKTRSHKNKKKYNRKDEYCYF